MNVDPNQVRAALDPTLSPKDLPDAIIAMAIYAGRATDEVKAQLSTEQQADQRASRAAVYLTAALLAPAMPTILSESIVGSSYTRNNPDAGKRAAELRQYAAEEVGAILSPTQSAADRRAAIMPNFFDAAPGSGRGQY